MSLKKLLNEGKIKKVQEIRTFVQEIRTGEKDG